MGIHRTPIETPKKVFNGNSSKPVAPPKPDRGPPAAPGVTYLKPNQVTRIPPKPGR